MNVDPTGLSQCRAFPPLIVAALFGCGCGPSGTPGEPLAPPPNAVLRTTPLPTEAEGGPPRPLGPEEGAQEDRVRLVADFQELTVGGRPALWETAAVPAGEAVDLHAVIRPRNDIVKTKGLPASFYVTVHPNVPPSDDPHLTARESPNWAAVRAEGPVERTKDGLLHCRATFTCPDWSPPDGFLVKCSVMCDRGITGRIPICHLTVDGLE